MQSDARASASPSSGFEVHWTLSRQRARAAEGQLTQQPCISSPAAVPSDACWLISLQLMAVQPACLRAHPDTPVLQLLAQDNQHEPQHGLLLHLEAVLLAQAAHEAPPTAQEQSSVGSLCPAIPLQLSNVELQLVLLSRQMQVIQQQQFILLQLIQQQQHQQLEQQQPVVLPSPASISTAANDSCCTGDSRFIGGASGGQAFTSSTETAASSAATAGTSNRWSMALNLHVSLPCRPTNRLLDALHLVLTVAGTPAQHPQQVSNSSVLNASSFPSDPGGMASSSTAHPQQLSSLAGLVAEVPLLVFPAIGQQEVQQLLLPAMRQEVQAEQQQHLQLQGLTELGPEHFAAQVLQVEYAAWRHYCQLANDIFTVMELSVAAEAEAEVAAAAAAASAHSPSLPAATQPMSSVAFVPSSSAGEGTAEPLFPAASTAALGEVAETLLFPLLLPFLAAHGLHHVLQLLVACLPLPLQQQWLQQQVARMQHLSVAAPPALQLPVVMEHEEQLQMATLRADAEMEVHTAATAASDAAEDLAVLHHQHGAAAIEAQQCQAVQTGGGVQIAQQQQAGSTSSWEMPGSPRKPAKQAAIAGSTIGAAAVGAPDVHVTWLTPLLQFEGAMEHRYLVWKHHSLIHLDYLCALFDIMYLAVLVKRMISEPATLWYFMYILIKTLPHVPLMLGLRDPFLRYREFWLFMVSPALVVLTVALTMASRIRGQPTVLLPARVNSAFLASRAELVTSFMRPFMQHMRLPLYIVFCLIDAAVAAWVAGQFLDVWTAVERWGVAALMSITVCWMFEFVLRRCFAREQRQGMQQRQVAGGAAAMAKGSACASSKSGLTEGASGGAKMLYHSSSHSSRQGEAAGTVGHQKQKQL